jgi:G3E family GTPase
VSQAIPTNLITGFLGVGKTTAVRHLLAQRPSGQRWAVLVNEFGEIGVDGAFLQESGKDDSGVAIAEVPGGCVCCVSSQAFTVGLNRLIREQRPDRILIEPTGLGHPAQILATLSGPYYQDVLEVRATITLIDARHLASVRHREHATWQDQVHLADVLVASKADLYGDAERDAFAAFAAGQEPAKEKVAVIEHGCLDPAWLDLPRQQRRAAFPEAHAFLKDHGHDHAHVDEAPASDWLMLEGRGDDRVSVGWRIAAHWVFDANALRALLDSIAVERLKGMLHTDTGWLAVNRSPDGGEWQAVAPRRDSRLELIHHEALDAERLDHELRTLVKEASPPN